MTDRELIEKLVDALEFEHQLAEKWRDFRGMESAEEFRPLIVEARAALAAPVVPDEWLTKCDEYINAIAGSAIGMYADELVNARHDFRVHLRARPAVPDTQAQEILRLRALLTEASGHMQGRKMSMLAMSQTRLLAAIDHALQPKEPTC